MRSILEALNIISLKQKLPALHLTIYSMLSESAKAKFDAYCSAIKQGSTVNLYGLLACGAPIEWFYRPFCGPLGVMKHHSNKSYTLAIYTFDYLDRRAKVYNPEEVKSHNYWRVAKLVNEFCSIPYVAHEYNIIDKSLRNLACNNIDKNWYDLLKIDEYRRLFFKRLTSIIKINILDCSTNLNEFFDGFNKKAKPWLTKDLLKKIRVEVFRPLMCDARVIISVAEKLYRAPLPDDKVNIMPYEAVVYSYICYHQIKQLHGVVHQSKNRHLYIKNINETLTTKAQQVVALNYFFFASVCKDFTLLPPEVVFVIARYSGDPRQHLDNERARPQLTATVSD